MSHGIYYEPEAIRVFEQVTGVEIYQGDVGLLVHETYDWIGASPDGVCKYFPFLLEIKCPFSANIKHACPKYYYTQVQLQLEVCDLDMCYFAQYQPPNSPLSDGLIDIIEISRNKDWWIESFPYISSFWEGVKMYYKLNNVEQQAQEWNEHVKDKKTKQNKKDQTCMIITKPQK